MSRASIRAQPGGLFHPGAAQDPAQAVAQAQLLGIGQDRLQPAGVPLKHLVQPLGRGMAQKTAQASASPPGPQRRRRCAVRRRPTASPQRVAAPAPGGHTECGPRPSAPAGAAPQRPAAGSCPAPDGGAVDSLPAVPGPPAPRRGQKPSPPAASSRHQPAAVTPTAPALAMPAASAASRRRMRGFPPPVVKQFPPPEPRHTVPRPALCLIIPAIREPKLPPALEHGLKHGPLMGGALAAHGHALAQHQLATGVVDIEIPQLAPDPQQRAHVGTAAIENRRNLRRGPSPPEAGRGTVPPAGGCAVFAANRPRWPQSPAPERSGPSQDPGNCVGAHARSSPPGASAPPAKTRGP